MAATLLLSAVGVGLHGLGQHARRLGLALEALGYGWGHENRFLRYMSIHSFNVQTVVLFLSFFPDQFLLYTSNLLSIIYQLHFILDLYLLEFFLHDFIVQFPHKRFPHVLCLIGIELLNRRLLFWRLFERV